MRGLDKQKELFKQLKNGSLMPILEEIKRNKLKYYLGIREECIDIYFMGGRMLQVKCGNNNIQFKLDEKYIPDKDKIKFNSLNAKFPINNATCVDHWINMFPEIEYHIANVQRGLIDGASVKKEKQAQQEILINNNLSEQSDFFITDMEYSTKGINFGRFDYIAISKEVDNKGKHKLVLIELKYDSDTFSGSPTKTSPYGSGIVGHVYNFNRFVSEEGKKLDIINNLKKETINNINNYCDLGLNKDYPEIMKLQGLKEIDISDEVETFILVVGCKNEKGSRVKNVTISLKKYLGLNEKHNAFMNVKNTLFKDSELNIKLKCYVTDDIPQYLKSDYFSELK